MVRLTKHQINYLTDKTNVKTLAVENFLLSMPEDLSFEDTKRNFYYDATIYSWNYETRKAVLDGIKQSFKGDLK